MGIAHILSSAWWGILDWHVCACLCASVCVCICCVFVFNDIFVHVCMYVNVLRLIFLHKLTGLPIWDFNPHAVFKRHWEYSKINPIKKKSHPRTYENEHSQKHIMKFTHIDTYEYKQTYTDALNKNIRKELSALHRRAACYLQQTLQNQAFFLSALKSYLDLFDSLDF